MPPPPCWRSIKITAMPFHPKGRDGVWADESSQRKSPLAGGTPHLCNIDDATDRLMGGGIKPNWARHWYAIKRNLNTITRALTFNVWLPVWHFCLGTTRPIRARLGLRSKCPVRLPKRSSPPAEDTDLNLSFVGILVDTFNYGQFIEVRHVIF